MQMLMVATYVRSYLPSFFVICQNLSKKDMYILRYLHYFLYKKAMSNGTAGKKKGSFRIPVPEKYRSGDFGSYEIIGFSSEKDSFMDAKGKVLSEPSEPAGSDRQKSLKPAYYLYAALPGADTELHYCGHGQDFFYAKAPEKQICYD